MLLRDKWRTISAFLVQLISITLLVVSFWPVNRKQHTIILQSIEPYIDDRKLLIDWPETLKLGETSTMTIKLSVMQSAQEKQPDSAGQNQSSHNSGGFPHVVVESYLDIQGINSDPPGVENQPMLKARDIQTSWKLSPNEPGTFSGTIWVVYHLFDSNGVDVERRPLLAYPLAIECVAILDTSIQVVRWMGGLGIVFSLILFFVRKSTSNFSK